jgi:Xaa-Pro aminopeptidase
LAGRKPDELLKIMKASAMGDTCFSHLMGFIREGMTELEVADEIEATLRKLGSGDLAFPTICVSGVNSTQPHGVPSDKRIEAGDFLTLDFGAIVDGYCGDMTRTVAIGHATDEQRAVYELVLKAQKAALAACKAGVRCFDVDKTARDIIAEAGYGEYFVHGTGHAVGTEVHEEPYLNTRSEAVLEINMPVTVEPGIYIPEKFGVRIEDLAIITEFGIINTVKSPKNLIIL